MADKDMSLLDSLPLITSVTGTPLLTIGDLGKPSESIADDNGRSDDEDGVLPSPEFVPDSMVESPESTSSIRADVDVHNRSRPLMRSGTSPVSTAPALATSSPERPRATVTPRSPAADQISNDEPDNAGSHDRPPSKKQKRNAVAGSSKVIQSRRPTAGASTTVARSTAPTRQTERPMPHTSAF